MRRPMSQPARLATQMTMDLIDLAGTRAVAWPADAPPLSSGRDAGDLIGAAFSHQARLVVLPVAHLSPEFLRLSSGLAGEVLQTFVNYGLRVAIVGDIAGPLAASAPLGDFVRESNRGSQVWFADDLDALARRLSGA